MQTIVSTTAQYDLSEIMSNAWAIAREKGHDFGTALRSAWAKAKDAVKKLAIDVAKLAELSVQELKDLRAALDATIQMKETGDVPREKKLAHKIRLEEKGGKVYTTSYYNTCFARKAKGLRGQWKDGQWVFQDDVRDHVVAAMESCYGVTGIQPYEVCTLLVTNYNKNEYRAGVELFGRPIAKAFGRATGAKADSGIFLIEGEFTSGGSQKNWRTDVIAATFQIHDYPVAALGREDVQGAIAEGWCAIKQEK